MEKRTILAIILSVAVLFIYSAIISKMYPVANKKDTIKRPALLQGAPNKTIGSRATSKEGLLHPLGMRNEAYQRPSLGQVPLAREYIEFENERFKIVFANPGAYISKVILKEYNAQLFLGDLLLASDEALCNFKVTRLSEAIIFTFRDANREIVKRFSMPNYSYNIELERTVRNFTRGPTTQNYQFFLASKISHPSAYESRFMELAISQPQKILRKNLPRLKHGTVFVDSFDWLGMRDRYFAFVIKPPQGAQNIFVNKTGQETQVGFRISHPSLSSLSTNSYVDKFTVYIGPQDVQKLAASNLGFENILYFGFFDVISQMLLAVLKFFFRFVHNWGVAILLFGLFIFLFLYPLTLKQMRSMKEMQILQPEIKALQEKYKTEPQKLNKEMLQLYREHKVNPLGGCLPLLFQIPIFIALYQVLMRFVGLRGARFLWIRDLSQPDRLFVLSQKFPIIGNEINILPLLMMASMFVQQKFSTAAMSAGSSSEQQKIMAIMMPLLFGFIFYHMPSGLVLYWFEYGLLTGLYQLAATRQRRIR